MINLEKPVQPYRSRSASFSEDLTARLQALAAGNSYRSYTPATIPSTPRSIRPSLNTNIRFPPVTPSNPSKTTTHSINFQLRYEQTIETLFVTIFQLQNYPSGSDYVFSKCCETYFLVKNTQHVFLILYLLPNDDEQRQSQSSTNGLFNEHFQFPVKRSTCTSRNHHSFGSLFLLVKLRRSVQTNSTNHCLHSQFYHTYSKYSRSSIHQI